MEDIIKSPENQSARLCYLCGSTLDENKCCTNMDCDLCNISQ